MQKNQSNLPSKNIAICIPSTDFFTADFSMCLAQFCHLTHHRLAFVNTRSSYIPDNRNNAVKTVLEANRSLVRANQLSHILFLDNDLIFPADMLDRLLARDRSIVGAAYPMRTPPHALCYSPLKSRPGVEENGMIEVAGLPTGAMLIDVHVFTQIPRPWFEQKYYVREDIDIDATYSTPFTKYLNEYFVGDLDKLDYPVSISCDFWFGALCRRAGYSLWLDKALTTELEHVGQKPVKFTDSSNYKAGV